jgi:hypothetical protein
MVQSYNECFIDGSGRSLSSTLGSVVRPSGSVEKNPQKETGEEPLDFG